jgi:hypothetical protein
MKTKDSESPLDFVEGVTPVLIADSMQRQWKIGQRAFDYTHSVHQHCCPQQGSRVLATKLLTASNDNRLDSNAQRFNLALTTYLALKGMNKQNKTPMPFSQNITNCVEGVNELFSPLWWKNVKKVGLRGLIVLLVTHTEHLDELAAGKSLPHDETVQEVWLNILLITTTAEMIYSNTFPHTINSIETLVSA